MVVNRATIVKLVDENRSRGVNFGTKEDGPPDDWIAKAQDRIGLTLPPSYVWFLREFGWGEIFGDEIFSIYGLDFDNIEGGDIVHHFILDQKNEQLKSDEIAISESDQGVVYILKTSTPDEEGEFPVYSKFAGLYRPYAKSFLEFLYKRLTVK